MARAAVAKRSWITTCLAVLAYYSKHRAALKILQQADLI
jgi:hypothetical protein